MGGLISQIQDHHIASILATTKDSKQRFIHAIPRVPTPYTHFLHLRSPETDLSTTIIQSQNVQYAKGPIKAGSIAKDFKHTPQCSAMVDPACDWLASRFHVRTCGDMVTLLESWLCRRIAVCFPHGGKAGVWRRLLQLNPMHVCAQVECCMPAHI